MKSAVAAPATAFSGYQKLVVAIAVPDWEVMDRRVSFDFEIQFANGGGIQGQFVESLRDLDQLPIEGFTFTAAPPRTQREGTFAVRAYARLTP